MHTGIHKVFKVTAAVMFCLVTGLLSGASEANVDETKLYKEAFPGSKPKCIICHIDNIPKKDDGMHDLNAYGEAVKGLGEVVTVEALQELGTAEDFTEGAGSAEMEKSEE